MKNRLRLLVSYYSFWVVAFVVFKLVFLIYHHQESFDISLSLWVNIFAHGAIMILSISAYISMLPFLLVTFSSFYFAKKFLKIFLKIYTYIVLFVTILITCGDAELFGEWHNRIDASVLLYLKNPAMAAASTSLTVFVKLFAIGGFVYFLLIYLYNKLVESKYKLNYSRSFISFPILLFVTAFLILPIRGGVGVAPLNPGRAYFHENQFVNNAALNGVWNFLYSLSKMNKNAVNTDLIDQNDAQSKFNSFYDEEKSFEKILNTKNPNVIFIIMESFTAKVVEGLGMCSHPGVTNNLKQLSDEGVWFTNCYASGDRTDRGIVSVLSAFPAQPGLSIIKNIKKSTKLPSIAKQLDGYNSQFVYGSTLKFANYQSYLLSSGFQKLIDIDDYSSSLKRTEWGVFDEVMFDRFLVETNNSQQPFFNVCLSLTSHPPYEIPTKPHFLVNNEDDKFLNSCYYSDHCLGEFINKAKKQKWWDSTLVVIVADHGTYRPRNTPNYSHETYKIPMLWLGGALKKPLVVDKICSQTDIAKSLLLQLDRDASMFKYSKNVFNNSSKSFAFYTFNSGFGFVNDSLTSIFNNKSNKYIEQNSPSDEPLGKAYQQILMQNYKDL